MMSILNTLFGASDSSALTATERDLLDSIRTTSIPDPAALRSRLNSLRREVADLEREWDRLDARGDVAAFVARGPLAERLQGLKAQAEPLPTQIERAEHRRAAFLEAARLLAALDAEVSARLLMLIERWPTDADERAAELEQLDRCTRLRSRLAGRLAAVSAATEFRVPPDAFKVLRDDLEGRIAQLDRLRTPGMRRPCEWPALMSELLAVVEDKERVSA